MRSLQRVVLAQDSGARRVMITTDRGC